MIKKTLQRGFTLIELLVVIAIIGILAATVLASLGSARSSGSDASAKGSINSMKAQAEIIYNSTSPNSYATVCSAASTAALITAIGNNSADDNKTVTVGAASTATAAACNHSLNAWAISAPMNGGGQFCADSTGYSGVQATFLTAAGDYTCG